MSENEYDVDLFVIGGGSGGVRAARVASELGARVALAEERYLGGTCVNVGCVPKKLLWYASHHGELFHDAAGFGWELGEPHFRWETLRANKDREIARLNGIYRRLLEDAGVRVIDARARLVDRQTVEVAGQRLRARHVLLAVGGHARIPDVPGRDLLWTSDDIFYLERVPERVVVVGGGYIAVEMAGILNGLGAHVELIYRGELFLRGFDEEIRRHLAQEMRQRGIVLHFERTLAAFERRGEQIAAFFEPRSGGSPEPELVCDGVLCAIGREPSTTDLGLDAAGVALRADGSIAIDALSRTSVDNIWAIGDVAGRMQLTPSAIHEAMCLAQTLFGGREAVPDLALVPTAVFSQPPFATVGMTEEEAVEAHRQVDVFSSAFRPLRLSLTDNPERTLMKIVVERPNDRVVGVHVIGDDAAEIVQCAAVALRMGATKADFDRTIGIHPTSAEELVTMRSPARRHG